MFSYNIAKNPDNKAFKDICSKIESKMNDLIKEELLVDVDGTVIKTYYFYGGEIRVYNDYLISAVHVDSNVSLEAVIS